ncbi:crossover junction endodeoxyribonuclease RuvC [bacterium]|nr:crossover junction endodeoxyribonuclease RuvC [bacterium]|tara:strand:- start:6571 stop:7038 length:468 start_codon:yes stop_codon:yes gene_type:complete
MIILGIDPGTTRVGYGVVEQKGSKFSHLESGLLSASSGTLSERLVFLEKKLESLLLRTNPQAAGVESVYFYKNQKTAIEVAEARGVVLLVLERHAVTLVELSPPEVKLAVSGDGSASKAAVARMVSHFLGESVEKKLDDVTDALAVAIAASGRRL